MAERHSVEDRLDAVERALTDGHAADGLPEVGRLDSRLDDLEATVEDIDDRLADLEAAVQALRGFAGGVRAVDEAVERRADAAVAAVDRLESDLRTVESRLDGLATGDRAEGEGAREARVETGPDTDHPRTDSRPTDDRSRDERHTHDRSTDDRHADRRPTEDERADDRPIGDHITGSDPTGDRQERESGPRSPVGDPGNGDAGGFEAGADGTPTEPTRRRSARERTPSDAELARSIAESTDGLDLDDETGGGDSPSGLAERLRRLL